MASYPADKPKHAAEPPKETAESSTRDKMSWAIGILGAIIGIAISVHGCTITQSKESSDRYAAFRTAVLTEEKSWKDLYDEYLKTFEKEQLENAPLRQNKLFALQAIAARDIASFQEF